MHRNKVYLIKFCKRLLLELAFVLSLSVICRLSPVLVLCCLLTVGALSVVAVVTLSYHSAQRNV